MTLVSLLENNAILTREDWEEFLAHVIPPRPPLLTRSAYDELSPRKKFIYDQQRDDWHADFGFGTTETYIEAESRFMALMKLNIRTRDPVKQHLALSGPPTLGKTTIATALAKWFALWLPALLEARGEEIDDEHQNIWVVYVTLTAETGTRHLDEQIAFFLGMTVSDIRAYGDQQLTNAVKLEIKRHRTKLIIVDDLHLLKPGRENTDNIRDHLKSLTSQSGAALLVVGIELETTNLFEEKKKSKSTKAGQTGGRFEPVLINRIERGSPEWISLVTWCEEQLVLMEQPQGDLLKLQKYLWNRTQGSIGSLLHLIRKAAIVAVQSKGPGKEKPEHLTKEFLDEVTLDYNATKYGNKEA